MRGESDWGLLPGVELESFEVEVLWIGHGWKCGEENQWLTETLSRVNGKRYKARCVGSIDRGVPRYIGKGGERSDGGGSRWRDHQGSLYGGT